MPIYAQSAQKQEQVPAGTYVARCYSMIHIGTVSFEYQGQTQNLNKVRITFELPTEKKVFKEGEQARPFSISREFTLSLHEKSKLRPFLEGWRSRAFTDEEVTKFDIAKLVGVPAMISILHNEKGYAEISSASMLPKGVECPSQINASQVLSYDDWNDEVFSKLPDFLKKKIESSKEYKIMKGEIAYNSDDYPPIDQPLGDGEIPF